MYTREVLQQFQNTRHVGELTDASAYIRVHNPACGDLLLLAVKIVDGCVVDAKFRARGCVATIASASQLVDMILGQRVEQAQTLSAEMLAKALGGLPPASQHATHLAIEALGEALKLVSLRPGG